MNISSKQKPKNKNQNGVATNCENISEDKSRSSYLCTQTFSHEPILNYTNHQQSIINLKNHVLKRVLIFLKPEEVFGLTLVHPTLKKHIECHGDYFQVLRIHEIPTKVPLSGVRKQMLLAGHKLRELVIPCYFNSTDTSNIISYIPFSLEKLEIRNISLDYRNIFSKKVFGPGFKTISQINDDFKATKFDKKDMEALTQGISMISELKIKNAPVDDDILKIILSGLKNQNKLTQIGCDGLVNYRLKKGLSKSNKVMNTTEGLTEEKNEGLTNKMFEIIASECYNLVDLKVGGEAMNYNNVQTKKGIKLLVQGESEQESITFKYCTKVGNDCLKILALNYFNSLKELSQVRNCYEKCQKINDDSLEILANCYNLERLTIVYTRKFSYDFPKHISENFRKLRYLNLRSCPLQEDLSFQSKACPNLEELNLSGDSWVKSECIAGLAKHPRQKILHIGHIEHGDMDCEEYLKDGYVISQFITEKLFKNPENFVALQTLYLEQVCQLTYCINGKIKEYRPYLNIMYTPGENDYLTNTIPLQ